MIKLPCNPEPVSHLLALLEGSPDQLQFLTGVVQQHGSNPQDFYARNPSPDTDWASMQALPAFQSQDWMRMAHPYVIAQLLVDLCEKASAPLPDNLYVGVDGAWQPLSYVQPTYVRPAAPAPVPAPMAPAATPAPVAAPAAVDAFPAPVSLAATPPPPTSLTLQPGEIEQEFLAAGEQPAMVTREVMGAAVTMPAQTAQQVDAARETPRATLDAAPVVDVGLQGGTPHAASQPAAAPAPAPATTTQYGLPVPTVVAPKGAGPFDKDPGGEPPKAAQRQIRDVFDMMPRMFAQPAVEVVGKGTGSAQRLRVYLGAVSMLRTALASVPDQTCPVGYLLWQLDSLRYEAAQSAAGPTMLAFEKWLLQGPDHD